MQRRKFIINISISNEPYQFILLACKSLFFGQSFLPSTGILTSVKLVYRYGNSKLGNGSSELKNQVSLKASSFEKLPSSIVTSIVNHKRASMIHMVTVSKFMSPESFDSFDWSYAALGIPISNCVHKEKPDYVLSLRVIAKQSHAMRRLLRRSFFAPRNDVAYVMILSHRIYEPVYYVAEFKSWKVGNDWILIGY